MLGAQSLPQLLAMEAALNTRRAEEEAALAKEVNASKEQVISKLSQYIQGVWLRNKEANRAVRLEMVRQIERSKGEYDSNKLAAIKAFKGSEVYIRSAENKCRAAYSWITDIYRGDTDLPWALEPTARPTLPDDVKAGIQEQIMAQGMQMREQLVQQAAQTGNQVDLSEIAMLMQDWQKVAEKKAQETLQKDAKERCEVAAQIIRDQNQEGGWNNAFKNMLWYFIRVKAGIIKGPILTMKKKQVWQPSADGSGFEFAVTDDLTNDVYCVSPFNFFPSKGMCIVDGGDIIEIHKLTKQSLSNLIGVPGYSKEEISAVLAGLHSGDLKQKWFTLDDETQVAQAEREKLANTTGSADLLLTDEILAQEFYGTVSGRLLKEWDTEGIMTAETDADTEYQVNCWKIGDHVIKAVINPDNLGRKPYHVSSWAKSPSSIWGEGLLEFGEPIEDVLNSITRALQNNIAIASGPLVEINSDRVDDRTPNYPWKQIYSTSAQITKEGAAVTYYQPAMHTQELIGAWQFFAKVLDEMTVPAYAQGASQSGVTAGTATVFTQLLAGSTRSIKAVVANLDDDILTPYLQMCYDYNMKFGKDTTSKGDASVVAKGVSGLLAKEQMAQRKTEYLQIVASPLLSQILGPKNLGAILAQIAKSNDLKLPDMDRLEGNETLDSLFEKMTQAQAGIDTSNTAGAGGTPTNPQATTPDGRPAGAPELQQPAQIGQ